MSLDLGIAAEIVADALRSGADHAELFFRSYRNLSVEIKDQALESFSSSSNSGYAVRVIRNRRLGFSFSTDIREARNVVSRATEASGSADEDPFLTFAVDAPLSDVPVCDDSIRTMQDDTAIRLALQIEKAAYDADRRIKRTRKPKASFTVFETVIANSCGINARYDATACSAQISVVAESGGESQTGWDYRGSRFLKDISFEEAGRTAAASAVRLLGSRRIRGTKADIILDSTVANEFLGVLASSLSADVVQKSKSLLAGRLHSCIISPQINITDSGLLPGRIGSRPIDDEGVASQTTQLVQEGTLLSYLFNTVTANKAQAVSTGNSLRGGFSSLPSVGVTNIFIEPSGTSTSIPKHSFFRTLQKGLYVVDAMGVHTANPISGDFSVGVSGLWIERGEVAFPVKEALISGNLLEFFSKVSAVGDDIRFFGPSGSPSLLISDVDISA